MEIKMQQLTSELFNKNMKVEKCESPFPHAIINDFLDEGVFLEIKEKLPKWDDFPRKTRRGGRRDISNYHYGNSGAINKLFKKNPKLELLYLVMSSEFFKRFCLDMFGVAIEQKNEALKIPITFDVAMARDSYINVPHVDGDFHLISGLFYFGNELIKSGGNILLHQPPEAVKLSPKYQPDQVKVEKKISPRANTLVFWENSSTSIHSTDPLIGDRRFLYFSIDHDSAPAFRRPWDTKSNDLKVKLGGRRTYSGLNVVSSLRKLRKKNRFEWFSIGI